MKDIRAGQKKQLYLSLVCVCGCLFFTTCGLDTIVSLKYPTDTHNLSYPDTDDYTRWYVDFESAPNEDEYPSDFSFLGTEIYYKIYNSTSVLTTHRATIDSLNTETNYGASATRMIETYGYKTLGTSPVMNWSPFVEGGKKRVQLRLKSYKYAVSSPDYSALYRTNACVSLGEGYYGFTTAGMSSFSYDDATGAWTDANGTAVDFSAITFVVPYRNGNQYSFDFFDDDDSDSSGTHDREPQDGDADYNYSSSAGTETYYVQLYAVAVGRDTNYTLSYSLVLDLGTIPISKE